MQVIFHNTKIENTSIVIRIKNTSIVIRILQTHRNTHFHKISTNNFIKLILCGNMPNYQVMGCVRVPTYPQKSVQVFCKQDHSKNNLFIFPVDNSMDQVYEHVSEFSLPLLISFFLKVKTSSKWVKHKNTKEKKQNLGLRYFSQIYLITVELL